MRNPHRVRKEIKGKYFLCHVVSLGSKKKRKRYVLMWQHWVHIHSTVNNLIINYQQGYGLGVKGYYHAKFSQRKFSRRSEHAGLNLLEIGSLPLTLFLSLLQRQIQKNKTIKRYALRYWRVREIVFQMEKIWIIWFLFSSTHCLALIFAPSKDKIIKDVGWANRHISESYCKPRWNSG